MITQIPIGLAGAIAFYAQKEIASRPFDQGIMRSTPGEENDIYIKRWMVLRKEPGPIENLYLHEIQRGDQEDAHCHPWPNISIPLHGWFDEWTPEGTFRRRPGDVVIRDATAVHAIVDAQPMSVSLFITGPKVRDWGFHTPHGFLPEKLFRDYRRLVDAGDLVDAEAYARQHTEQLEQ